MLIVFQLLAFDKLSKPLSISLISFDSDVKQAYFLRILQHFSQCLQVNLYMPAKFFVSSDFTEVPGQLANSAPKPMFSVASMKWHEWESSFRVDESSLSI